MRLAFLAMLLLALAGGCLDEARDPAGPAGEADAASGDATGDDAAQAGSPGGAAAQAEGANATAAGPDVDSYEGSWTAGVYVASLPSSAVEGRVPYSLALDGSESGVLVEMRWAPSSTLSETMGLEVFLDGDPVGGAAGASPVRVTLPAVDGEYVINARASGPMDVAGAFVTQDYTLHVAVFKGGPLDEAYDFG